jgi:hypothetical protein
LWDAYLSEAGKVKDIRLSPPSGLSLLVCTFQLDSAFAPARSLSYSEGPLQNALEGQSIPKTAGAGHCFVDLELKIIHEATLLRDCAAALNQPA